MRDLIAEAAKAMSGFNLRTEAAVKVDDAPYRRSHMTSPKGRGGWMFSTKPSPDLSRGSDDPVFFHTGTYADSRAAAIVWAKGIGASVIYALP